jgi:hypothetical protein
VRRFWWAVAVEGREIDSGLSRDLGLSIDLRLLEDVTAEIYLMFGFQSHALLLEHFQNWRFYLV